MFLRVLAHRVRSERGASATEYAMIAAMVAVGAGIAAALFGEILLSYVHEISDAVTDW